jgi:PglZ domain
LSPLLAPDLPDIERAIDGLLQKDADARVLGMRSPARKAWPEAIERRGRRFRIAWCPSELEVREQLDQTDGDDGEGLVILTPLDETKLGDDVIARFPRARLEQTDRWSALRAAFRARDVDPRLRADRWLADLLLEHVPVGGYAPVPGRALDLESAWRAALEDVLSLPDGRADASALLDWSLDSARFDRFVRLSADAQNTIAARVSAQGGAAARLVLAAATAGRGGDALPIALACGVVFGEQDPRHTLREAAVRLEPLLGGARIDPDAARALAEAGRRVLDRLTRETPTRATAVEARAAAILAEIRADTAAALSPALQVGLDARMEDAAAAILTAIETASVDDVTAAWGLAQRAANHDRVGENRGRVDRLVMAIRLVKWLAGRPTTTWRGISEAAADYAGDGGFVDRARHAIRSGDPLPEVAAAYARLAEMVMEKREEQNRAFASTLRDWNSAGAQGEDPLPVERILSDVVAPLAREAPVLLLVLDGLSFAVWRVLAETVGRFGWSELVRPPRHNSLIAVAVLPSVTQVSRASLLCGTLTRGDQAAERAGFAAHASLVTASRAGRPPRLFHKADIGTGPELGDEVRTAVADPQQRIVGVVHNAVDAQLSGSDQLDLTWSAEGLRQVAALLHVARGAGRVVIVTGDHGHLLDEGTAQLTGGSGDRWRSAGAPPGETEVALSGGRVVPPSSDRAIITAWSERVRFAARRSGYHGGASPQEVLVPVAVLSAGNTPGGWIEAPPMEPAWWRGEDPTQPGGAAVEASFLTPRRRGTETRQGDLFVADRRADADREAHDKAAARVAWLDDLLASEIYAAQRRLAGRGAPTDDLVRRVLTALALRGGRMTRTGLSQTLEVPTFRLSGFVSSTRRVLNLDQAQVIREDADDIVLDEALLKTQFGLGADR